MSNEVDDCIFIPPTEIEEYIEEFYQVDDDEDD